MAFRIGEGRRLRDRHCHLDPDLVGLEFDGSLGPERIGDQAVEVVRSPLVLTGDEELDLVRSRLVAWMPFHPDRHDPSCTGRFPESGPEVLLERFRHVVRQQRDELVRERRASEVATDPGADPPR